MRALTVRPPWSWAITHGGKTVENRTWPIPRMQPADRLRVLWPDLLAIHAGAASRWDPAGAADPLLCAAWRTWTATLPPGNLATPTPSRRSLHIDFGAIVAVAHPTCHPSSVEGGCAGEWPWFDGQQRPRCSPWAVPGQWHWILGGIRPLAKPVECRGSLGLWQLPDDIEQQVRTQLEAPGGR
jgi:hypothetical protein